MLSCTGFFVYEFLARTRTQIYPCKIYNLHELASKFVARNSVNVKIVHLHLNH